MPENDEVRRKVEEWLERHPDETRLLMQQVPMVFGYLPIASVLNALTGLVASGKLRRRYRVLNKQTRETVADVDSPEEATRVSKVPKKDLAIEPMFERVQ